MRWQHKILTLIFTVFVFNGYSQTIVPLSDGITEDVKLAQVVGNELYCVYKSGDLADSTNYSVAKWNGLSWSEYPPIILKDLLIFSSSYEITSIAKYNGSLYASGRFTNTVGLNNMSHIFKFEGGKWVNQMDGVYSKFDGVNKLLVYNNELYALGKFDNVNGTPADNIAKYNGTNWSYVGNSVSDQGTDGEVYDGAVIGSSLNIVGEFTKVISFNTGTVARFNGSIWGGISSPFSEKATSITDYGSNIAVLGSSGGEIQLQSFDGSTWTNLNSSLEQIKNVTSDITSIAGNDGNLWVTGVFDGASTNLDYVLSYDGDWKSYATIELNNKAKAVSSNGNLYFYGNFKKNKTTVLNNIGKYSAKSSYISGYVFFDENQNCQRDISEIGLNELFVKMVPFSSSKKTIIVTTDATGFYEAYVDPGSYTITTSLKKNWKEGCRLAPVLVNTFDMKEYNNISLWQPDNNRDVTLKLSHLGNGSITPNDPFYMNIYAANNGGVNVNSQFICLTLPEGVDIDYSTPKHHTSVDGKITWTIPLGVDQEKMIHVKLKVKDGVALGDKLRLELSDCESAGDSDPEDNDDFEVLGVEDAPNTGNYKTVNFSGDIFEDVDSLYYAIHFQNISGGHAKTITITDTIDLSLRMDRFIITEKSHHYRAEVIDGHILVFNYDDINLPTQQMDDSLSKGFVRYLTVLHEDLPIGTRIVNTATIDYDYANQFITNTTETVIAFAVSVPEPDKNGIRYYPNPATDQFRMEFEQDIPKNIDIYSLDGRMVHTVEAGERIVDMNLSFLRPGIYFVKMAEFSEAIRIQILK
jgi:hypothetical protein